MDFATVLFHAHSGLRYLVLLAGVLSLGYSLFGMIGGRSWDRPGRILLSSFVGLMDLQVVIGLVLAFVYVFYPALWGHLLMMILAAVVGHVAAAVNKRRPPERQSHRTAVLGSATALILIIGGIMAISRTIL
jgi:MFS family permease